MIGAGKRREARWQGGEIQVAVDEQTMRITLPAALGHIEPVCEAVKGHMAEQGVRADEFCLLLGLREALANAILHGAREDTAKEIWLEVTITPEMATIIVEDPGDGFDWREQPLEPPPPDATRGRGLAILRNCFETMRFNARGNRIQLGKYLRRHAAMSEITREGKTVRVAPQRDIVAAMISEFKQELKTLVEEGGTRLELDFTGVEMVDSIGIGLLITTHNSLRASEGSLALVHVSPDIASLFRTMRLDKHFEMLDS